MLCKNLCTDPALRGRFLIFFCNRDERGLTASQWVCNHWLQYEANRSQTYS